MSLLGELAERVSGTGDLLIREVVFAVSFTIHVKGGTVQHAPEAVYLFVFHRNHFKPELVKLMFFLRVMCRKSTLLELKNRASLSETKLQLFSVSAQSLKGSVL